jgi:hypothetical protein
MNIIPKELVEQIEFTTSREYDEQLFALGKGLDEFYVVNPIWPEVYTVLIDRKLKSNSCIMWVHEQDWLFKRFHKHWKFERGYKIIELSDDEMPQMIWKRNPAIDKNILFTDDPQFVLDVKIPRWEITYKYVWYLDPKYCKEDEKIWVYECHSPWVENEVKDMGNLAPELDLKITHNADVIDLEAEINYIPHYSDFAFEHIWYLDPKLTNGQKTWIAKLSAVNETTGIKDMGIVVPESLPEQHWKINQDIPKCIQFETDPRDYIIPNWDLKYKHIWYLNPEFTDNKLIWIYSCESDSYDPDIGIKDMGYVNHKLNVVVDHNPEIQDLKANVDYNIKYSDVEYKHVWYVDPKFTNGRKIWLTSMSAVENTKGTKDMGYIIPDVAENLDVVFISYNEPNAEDNWKRVLSKAPNALRVNGVKGIFEAHRAAAELAKSDMFYVVDGDAFLEDDWEFDFNPSIFDRDCVHVYKSRNPINNLIYGYGGVKLFPRKLLLNAKEWEVDMTTSIASKLKVINKISNTTAFNTDPLSAWRSAFRECAKLAAGTITNQNVVETERRLTTWMTEGADKPFGEYALAGAKLGYEYGNTNKLNIELMKQINDREWLEAQFKDE